MDCPSEENLIKLKLNGLPEIVNLDFDIPNRKLIVYHNGGYQTVCWNRSNTRFQNYDNCFCLRPDCKCNLSLSAYEIKK